MGKRHDYVWDNSRIMFDNVLKYRSNIYAKLLG